MTHIPHRYACREKSIAPVQRTTPNFPDLFPVDHLSAKMCNNEDMRTYANIYEEYCKRIAKKINTAFLEKLKFFQISKDSRPNLLSRFWR